MEQLLRETFARHEDLVPVATPSLRQAIAVGARRRLRLRRLCGGSLAALLAIISAFVITQRPPSERQEQQLLQESTKPLTFLLLGTDRRPGTPAGEVSRTDAIVVVHVDPAAGRAYQLSIPRDLLVDLPGRGPEKVNAAYAVGGYALTAQIVTKLTGLPLDGGAVVDFAGLQAIVEAVGGVDLCVDKRTRSVHLGRDGRGAVVSLGGQPDAQPIVYEPGCRSFAAWEALDYVRQRGDVDRDRHLRDLLVALLRKLGNNPAQLGRVLPVAAESLELHLEGRTLPALAGELGGLSADDVTGVRLPTRPTAPDALALEPEAEELFAAMRAGDLAEWLTAHPALVS